MTPIRFPGSNAVLGMTQDEYVPLPCRLSLDGRILMCFSLTDEELLLVAKTRYVWVEQLTFGRTFQPLRVMTRYPE